MNRDQLIQMAREAAVDCEERHSYMPATPLLSEAWQPHQWVLDAMEAAAHKAEQERNQYRSGNTACLEALMLAHEDRDDANMARGRVLHEAGMLQADGSCNWPALEDRKPKRKTWEEAVRECITDPAEVERLLAMGDSAHPESCTGGATQTKDTAA